MVGESKSRECILFFLAERDVLLAREILIPRPYRYKKGTKESGNAWVVVVNSLNSCKDLTFNVTVKSLRDHYNLLIARRAKKLRVEEIATGGRDVDVSELDVL